MIKDLKTENFVKAITYGNPSELTVLAGFLPAAWLKYGDKLEYIREKYSDLVGNTMKYDETNMPKTFYKGKIVDGWGCEWANAIDGMEAIVTGHPLKTEEDMLALKIPTVDMGTPHGFMYLRILDLLGFENAMIAFAEESEALEHVIEVVLEYNISQIKKQLANYDYPIIMFGDDLGMQTGLAIGADKWRKYFKPCYKKMYDYCHSMGKLVYMHTDGRIFEIMPDLKEVGVDMINPQFRANGIDNLERVCKGKIPIALDLDRQMFPFASKAQLKAHVQEIFERLYLPSGGLALNIEFGQDVSIETMDYILELVTNYRDFIKA